MISKKIALFGGSFNPVHKDHENIVLSILKEKLVDEIWLIPCKNHSFNKKLVPYSERVKMLELAFEQEIKKGRVKISEIENEISGKSYTYKTVKKLKENYPGNEFLWTIGTDILHQIKDWYRFNELKDEVSFIVLQRPGYEYIDVEGVNIWKFLEVNLKGISSTEIRENIKNHDKLKSLLNSKVLDFINEQGLYKK